MYANVEAAVVSRGFARLTQPRPLALRVVVRQGCVAGDDRATPTWHFPLEPVPEGLVYVLRPLRATLLNRQIAKDGANVGCPQCSAGSAALIGQLVRAQWGNRLEIS